MKAYFVKFPEDLEESDTKIRYLTNPEKDHLLAAMAERLGGDAYSDLMFEFAQEATKGIADSIVIEET